MSRKGKKLDGRKIREVSQGTVLEVE